MSLSRAFLFTYLAGILLFCLGYTEPAHAHNLQPGIELFSSFQKAGQTHYTVSIQILLLLTILTFLPAIVLMMTGFTRIMIVLSIIRHAIGIQTAPPNQVIIGLSFFLTLFVMQPTITRIYQASYQPFSNNQISFMTALQNAVPILSQFMMKQTRKEDLALFARVSHTHIPNIHSVPLTLLIPAFVISELKTAFEIGFLLFIPFLIIDMLVASTLLSLGMMMVSPSIISLPFKIMIFVVVDGWHLLVGSLMHSFH